VPREPQQSPTPADLGSSGSDAEEPAPDEDPAVGSSTNPNDAIVGMSEGDPMNIPSEPDEPGDDDLDDAGTASDDPGADAADSQPGDELEEPDPNEPVDDLDAGDPSVDAEGCPLTLEGFATVNALGQNGTTGGEGGQVVTVTNQADLANYAGASEPYVIRVQGPITISPKGEEIDVASNKTIVGVGTSGEIVEGGFILEGSHNVIIRNLVVRDTFVEGDWEGKEQDFDGVQMDQAHHVWIDHCHFHHIGDGIIDSREDTTFLTVSWNILSDHNKAFGIGWTDNVTAEMTIHHNWLRDTGQRNPSTDNVLRAHLYNNWLLRVGSYGNYARGGTNMVLENSIFDDVDDPYYYDTGSLVAIGNIVRNSSGQEESSGSSYSFFNPNDFYEYTLDPAQEVESLLERCAGPRPEIGM
jgi:pectate lyase